MRRFYYAKMLLLIMIIVLMTVTPCLALKRVVPETTKDDIINKYLKERTLEAVEGIWSFSTQGFYGELAIIRNPSDV